ncbi:hypothetical protein PYCC9005_004093 [Savitreella phatthalungensis]
MGFLNKVGFKKLTPNPQDSPDASSTTNGTPSGLVPPVPSDLSAAQNEMIHGFLRSNAPSEVDSSRPSSIFDFGEKRWEQSYQNQLMLRHLYKRCRNNGWFKLAQDSEVKVALRAQGSDSYAQSQEELSLIPYLTAPSPEEAVQDDEGISLVDIAGHLQCQVIMQMTNKITTTLLKHVLPTVRQIPLDSSTQIQVLQSYADVHSLRRHQFAALIVETGSMLVWSDDAATLVPFAEELEKKMVNLVWSSKKRSKNALQNEKEKAVSAAHVTIVDLEGAMEVERKEPFVQAMIVAVALLALAVFFGNEIHEVVKQIRAEGNYIAIGIVLYFPLLFFFSSFFAYLIASLIFQLFGPISQLNTNSKYYSGVAPVIKQSSELPHITIQCPVYKEDLEKVLSHTFESISEAIRTYELQGGTASILVCEDGLQLLPMSERQKRLAYYKMHGIGYIARPPDGKDGFVRAGKFKKASNMNYALDFANRIEMKLEQVQRTEGWSDVLELQEYDRCLRETLAESAGAEADGNCRVGDLILLVDADTRVPNDCFLDAATEFHISPELAILQHSNDAFQVVNNFWEDTMAHFTRFVTSSMMWACANGDVAPFVGHNAFLRWSAVQELAWEEEGSTKYWSERHVSEDFELSLKLQNLGYLVRMASYSNGAFKEGVSLTVYDEISRWQKYAYGVSELMFHPLRFWVIRGPFTPLFRAFLRTRTIRGFSKLTMLAYMGTYYAIASWWPLAVINYFLIGWYNVNITNLYQSAFSILLSTLVVFNVFTPVINAIFRFRTGRGNLFVALFENMKYITLLAVFFGGLSMHITVPLICHLFEIPIRWGATAKTLEQSHFFRELPMIWRRFKYYYAVWVTLALGLVIVAFAVPSQWQIRELTVVLPIAWMLGCHIAAPIILNPQSFLSEFHL